jgi:flagellar hook-associated protein 1
VDSLKAKSDSVRGVNLDEEMSDLILFEQAYAAAARLIGVIQNMFEALERAVR